MPSSSASPKAVRFGLFEADFSAAELSKRGRKIPLQDQPFRVLGLLLRRPGELVTREEFQQALWPADTFVEFDEGLNKAIQKLRQALDDSSENPRFIETLPRKGYRFIAPVESVADEVNPTPFEPLPRPAWRPNREVLAWALVALLSLVLVTVVGVRQRPSEPHAVRFQLLLPDKVITNRDGIPMVSPNGRHLVFIGTNPDGKQHLYIHSLDSPATQLLTQIEQEDYPPFGPFWSPDSRFVGFFQGGKLKKIDITGGPPRVLCDAPFTVAGAAWNQEGTILFASSHDGLLRVSSTGGEPRVVLGLDKSRKELWQLFPHFFPTAITFCICRSAATLRGAAFIWLHSIPTRPGVCYPPSRMWLTPPLDF